MILVAVVGEASELGDVRCHPLRGTVGPPFPLVPTRPGGLVELLTYVGPHRRRPIVPRRRLVRWAMPRMTTDVLEAFLRQPHIGVLATLRSDGRPYTVPIWWLWQDGAFWLTGTTSRVWCRHLRRDPRASLCIEALLPVAGHVGVDGLVEAKLLPDFDIWPISRQLVDKYVPDDRDAFFATMQTELASMLHQKNRLAGLGLAVSKINHDLRNLLASAQLFSDRLAKIPDPGVQRFAPKLMHALERAIAFCQSTLSYGRLQEPPPDRRPILLEPLVEEVHENLGLGADAPIRWISAVERGLVVEADYDQLFRILLNLARNALQAMESQATEGRTDRDPGRDQIRITGRREGAVVVIEVSDTGPGFSEQAREHLFEAFQGSTRTGGTGLGLAIAAELVRAHGGEIRLVEGTIGATLRLTIPDRAVELAAHRGARAHG